MELVAADPSRAMLRPLLVTAVLTTLQQYGRTSDFPLLPAVVSYTHAQMLDPRPPAAAPGPAPAPPSLPPTKNNSSNKQLIILPKESSAETGAVCLDGSPPAMVLRESDTSADKNKWVLYIKGGGW